jgi:hypothetical protein
MKKILALVLAGCLLAGLVTGCEETLPVGSGDMNGTISNAIEDEATVHEPTDGEWLEKPNFSIWIFDGWKYEEEGSYSLSISTNEPHQGQFGGYVYDTLTINTTGRSMLFDMGLELSDNPDSVEILAELRRSLEEEADSSSEGDRRWQHEAEEVRLNGVDALRVEQKYSDGAGDDYEYVMYLIVDHVNLYSIYYSKRNSDVDAKFERVIQTFTLNPDATEVEMPDFAAPSSGHAVANVSAQMVYTIVSMWLDTAQSLEKDLSEFEQKVVVFTRSVGTDESFWAAGEGATPNVIDIAADLNHYFSYNDPVEVTVYFEDGQVVWVVFKDGGRFVGEYPLDFPTPFEID